MQMRSPGSSSRSEEFHRLPPRRLHGIVRPSELIDRIGEEADLARGDAVGERGLDEAGDGLDLLRLGLGDNDARLWAVEHRHRALALLGDAVDVAHCRG